jgi:hypothetical protein
MDERIALMREAGENTEDPAYRARSASRPIEVENAAQIS